MAPPAPAPLPPQSPEEIAAIQAREDSMDDDEYLASDSGKATMKQLIDDLSPRNGTPAVVVEEAFEALPATSRRLIMKYLDRKARMGQRMNKKENNVAKALGIK